MSSNPRELDDVALTAPSTGLGLTLDEVGLERVQTLATVEGQRIPALARAWVSLDDTKSRGIHMSRLYKIINRLPERELSWPWLKSSLEEMLLTHSQLSSSGILEISLDYPVLRPALVSGEKGWRTYPVSYQVASRLGTWTQTLNLSVLYSSTCPCSAALARQALRDRFAEKFNEQNLSREQILEWLNTPESVVASAHAQRSEARCSLTFTAGEDSASPLKYLDVVEAALGTAVQAAVKRADEQEFAKLNAQNLMFCEDAARRLKAALMNRKELTDFSIEVRHFESLHPHDVVAKARK